MGVSCGIDLQRSCSCPSDWAGRICAKYPWTTLGVGPRLSREAAEQAELFPEVGEPN